MELLRNNAKTRSYEDVGNAARINMAAAAAFVPYHFCDTQDSFQQKKSAKDKIE